MRIRLRRLVLNLLAFFFVSLLAWHFGLLNFCLTSVPAPELKDIGGVEDGEVVQTTREGQNSVFRQGFSFPQPRVMKTFEEIEASSWMIGLHSYLRTRDPSLDYIYLATSNFKYIDVLLNWLISAVVRSNVPIHQILIIAMDYATYSLLHRRKFHSLFIPPSSVFSPGYSFSEPFEEVMMLRLALMRIINHFGVGVAMLDTDAIMLRNPEYLFTKHAEADIVGSVGTIPDDLFADWGVTICIGMVLVRSSKETEEYWNGMKDIHRECVDDQGKLNYGLKALDVKWRSNSNHQNVTVHGQARNNLRVSILPYDDVCRLDTCVLSKRSRYYVWHKGGLRSRKKKLKSAREGKVWFLQFKWNSIHNDYVGNEWLRSIAYLGVTMN